MQPIKKLMLFQALCSLFLIYNATHTADSDQPNNSQKIKITLDFIDGENGKRSMPVLTDKLDLTEKENNTGKTFRELREKSTKRELPWLITAALILKQTDRFIDYFDLFIDYFDTIELIKTQGKFYNSKTFHSIEGTRELLSQSWQKYTKEKYPAYITIAKTLLLYPGKKSIEFGNLTVQYNLTNNNGYITSSAVSSALAINLCENYVPALALQTGIIRVKNNKPSDEKKYWTNTILKLPHETFNKTRQEFIKLYSVKVDTQSIL